MEALSALKAFVHLDFVSNGVVRSRLPPGEVLSFGDSFLLQMSFAEAKVRIFIGKDRFCISECRCNVLHITVSGSYIRKKLPIDHEKQCKRVVIDCFPCKWENMVRLETTLTSFIQ